MNVLKTILFVYVLISFCFTTYLFFNAKFSHLSFFEDVLYGLILTIETAITLIGSLLAFAISFLYMVPYSAWMCFTELFQSFSDGMKDMFNVLLEKEVKENDK